MLFQIGNLRIQLVRSSGINAGIEECFVAIANPVVTQNQQNIALGEPPKNEQGATIKQTVREQFTFTTNHGYIVANDSCMT